MSTEIPKQPHPGDNSVLQEPCAAGHNLSHEVFADPVEFLSTLKSTLAKANPDDPDNVTYRDLIAYASGNGDPRGRAAAAIAAQHWPELRNLDNAVTPHMSSKGVGLSADELDQDIDFARGNVQKELLNEQLGDGGQAAVLGVAAVGFTAGGFSTLPAPFLSIPSFITAAGFAAGFAVEANETFQAPGRFKAKVSQDQHLLAGWHEVNGDAGGKNPITR